MDLKTEQTSRLAIPEKNVAKVVTALLDSGYWIKVDTLIDGKALVYIKGDDV